MFLTIWWAYGAEYAGNSKGTACMVCRKSRNLKGELKNGLAQNRPEFAERFEYFAFQEVPNEEGRQLPEKIRYMAILAVLYRLAAARTHTGKCCRKRLTRRYAGDDKGNRVSGGRLFGLRQNAAVSKLHKRDFFAKRHRAAAPRSGDDNS